MGHTRLVAGAYFIIFIWSIWTRMCSYSIACVKPRYMSHYRQFLHQADYIFLLAFCPQTLLSDVIIFEYKKTNSKCVIMMISKTNSDLVRMKVVFFFLSVCVFLKTERLCNYVTENLCSYNLIRVLINNYSIIITASSDQFKRNIIVSFFVSLT